MGINKKNKSNEFFVNKIKDIEETLKCSYDTACIIAYLDSIGYRVYEVTELLKKEKKGK